MNVTTATLGDAGRLLAWAARPKDRPIRLPEYDALVGRYLDDEEFARVADIVAAGAGITLVVDRIVGVIGVAESTSPLRMPLADFRKRMPQAQRALLGVIVLAVARVAYPTSDSFDDAARVPQVSVAQTLDYLNRLVERLEAEADGDPIEGDEGLVATWRAWTTMRESRHDARRTSLGDRAGAVERVCRFFEEHGLLSRRSDLDGGTWAATERFRVAAQALVEDSDLFATVLALDPDSGATDTEGAGTASSDAHPWGAGQ